MALSKREKTLKDRFEELKSHRASYDTLWQQISDYIIPRKSDIQSDKAVGLEDYVNQLYDMTAAEANLTLAAGIMTNAAPPTERWFAFSPPEEISNDKKRANKVSAWYENCSAITAKLLGRSNFYTELHEAMLDRNAMGTCCLFTQEGKRELLNFRSLRVGTYCIEVDDEGYVDTIYREFEINARQAARMFGEEALGPKMTKDLSATGGGTEKYKVIHVVMPREDAARLPGAQNPENKAVASIWISCDEDHLIKESGFDEMPFAVGRFLQWKDREWGWGPGIQCLPVVRQVNFIEEKLDALAEIAVDPRLLIPSNMIDEVDFRAGGRTAYDPNEPGKPEEWMTNGRYDVGVDRVERKQKYIRDAFHNPLFQMFQNLERQITATEAMARMEEKLDVFSPTFQRITGEILNPTLNRVFSICFRAGVYPDPPAEAFIPTAEGVGLPAPEVVYTSKIALALRSKENGALLQTIQTIAPLVEADPTLMDVYDTPQIARDVSKNNAMPMRWLRSEKEVAEIQEARAKQEQQAQAMAMAREGAAAAKDLGQAPPEMREAAMGEL